MAEHIPVLAQDILQFAQNMKASPRHYLDGTFGRGGHCRQLMDAFPDMSVVAFDQDIDAIEFGRMHFAQAVEQGKIHFIHAKLSSIESHLATIEQYVKDGLFDLILVDLGVSSPQLDQAERGFSVYHDGPLDMRMDRSQSLTAAEIINTWSPEELSDLFFQYGEVRQPGRVVGAIIARREEKAFSSTVDLAELIVRVDGWRKKGQHPATKYFMALRLVVNDELAEIRSLISKLIQRLRPYGRLMIISFHSLEDRIVKYGFRDHSHMGQILTKKVVQASFKESKENPRARSAKLRVFEKGE